MKLAHFDQDKLTVSKANMHHGKKAPDVSHILPSIREKGIIVPLIVRPVEGDDPDRAEIVAGARRWIANRMVLGEGIDHGPLPCAVMEPGDDAAAIEASLLENIARRAPDEITEWRTYTRLVKEGRTPEQIGQTFGLTTLQVRRILALGDLLPRIRTLYGQEAIDVYTVRQLTLASKSQQKAWLALHDDPDKAAPSGYLLKAWLFGGQSIPTTMAIFPLDDYPGRIVTDLFGEDGYFDDADLFWRVQNEAVAALRDRYLDDGWTAVEVMEVGERFQSYDYEKTPKAKGGKVFITASERGEVTVYEGYVTAKEARRALRAAAKAEGVADPSADRPEVTSVLQGYIDLHRHAAARAVLADHPAVALRLLIAHAIAGSSLWRVEVQDRTARNEAVSESVEASPAEAAFAAKRRAVLALLKFDRDDDAVTRNGYDEARTAAVFARLVRLSDDDLLRVAAVVMGETLAAGGALVEAVGAYLKADIAAYWSPDDVFFDLIRDRPVANAMLREVGGRRVADANLSDKVKTQKAILRDFLDGANNRPKVEGWTPRWMAFPPARYTGRPFAPAAKWETVRALVRRMPAPDPTEAPSAPDAAPAAPEYAIAA